MKNSIKIAKREWGSLLAGPAYYVVLIVFLVLWEWLFFRNVFLVGEASLRILYDVLPWVLLLLVPSVTMGSIAAEKENGTLEWILTQPISEWELVVGKWLGVMGLPTAAMLFAIPLALTMAVFGPFDFGVFTGQLMGSIAVAGALAALGIYVSGKMLNQVAALLVTAVIGLLLVIVGTDFVAAAMPLAIAPILERLALVSHLQGMARGVIDLRDVWYFVSFVGTFLGLTMLGLMRRKQAKLAVKIWIVIGIVVVTNVAFDRVNIRLDLTRDQAYTLSQATRKIVGNLPENVSITLYASGKLPAQYSPVVRETRDLLRDYQNTAHGKLSVSFKDPSLDPKVATEAQGAGVRQIQFNVVGQEEFQVKTGFLGLAIAVGSSHESVPFLQDTSDLEYQLTSNIHKLTNKDKKTVAFLTGHGEKSLYADYSAFNTTLAQQFNVTSFSKEVEATSAATLVVAGPVEKVEDETTKFLGKLVASGKNLLLLVDSMVVSPQAMSATVNKDNFGDFAKGLGITIQDGAVYDLRYNETVRFDNYLLPYPFWARVAAADPKLPILKQTESMVLPWASALTIDEVKAKTAGYKVVKLLVTSKFAGNKTGEFPLTPDDKTFSQANLGEKTMAVELDPVNKSIAGKIVIIGNSTWLTDQFVQNSPENLNLGMAAISYLAGDDALAGIKPRSAIASKLLLPSPFAAAVLKYANLALAILLPAVVAVVKFTKRREKQKLTY